MAYGKITKKQAEILNYLKSEIINKGYPPSVREICNAVGLRSTSSVHAHLGTLEKMGIFAVTQRSHVPLKLSMIILIIFEKIS